MRTIIFPARLLARSTIDQLLHTSPENVFTEKKLKVRPDDLANTWLRYLKKNEFFLNKDDDQGIEG